MHVCLTIIVRKANGEITQIKVYLGGGVGGGDWVVVHVGVLL